MHKIKILEHEREINEDGWEHTGEFRFSSNDDDGWLDINGIVRSHVKREASTCLVPILRRKPPTGWNWLKSLLNYAVIEYDGSVYWIQHVNSTDSILIRGDMHWWSACGGFIDNFSADTCKIHYKGIDK